MQATDQDDRDQMTVGAGGRCELPPFGSRCQHHDNDMFFVVILINKASLGNNVPRQASGQGSRLVVTIEETGTALGHRWTDEWQKDEPRPDEQSQADPAAWYRLSTPRESWPPLSTSGQVHPVAWLIYRKFDATEQCQRLQTCRNKFSVAVGLGSWRDDAWRPTGRPGP